MGARQSVQQGHHGSGGAGPTATSRVRTLSTAFNGGGASANGSTAANSGGAGRSVGGARINGRSLSVSAVDNVALGGRSDGGGVAYEDETSDSSQEGTAAAAAADAPSTSTAGGSGSSAVRHSSSSRAQHHSSHRGGGHVRSLRQRLPQLDGGGGLRIANRRIPHIFGLALFDIKCPVCHKVVPSDEAEVHLVMCLTRPKLTYNEDVLVEEKGECVICLEDMLIGDAIARLPCLCIYHKQCIDSWFSVKNSCPEHPGDDD